MMAIAEIGVVLFQDGERDHSNTFRWPLEAEKDMERHSPELPERT